MRSIPYYCTYLAQKGLGRTWYNVQKKRILDKFKIQEGIVGEYYTQYKSMKAVIIGSDEIFALHTGPTPVFWGYALPSDNVLLMPDALVLLLLQIFRLNVVKVLYGVDWRI